MIGAGLLTDQDKQTLLAAAMQNRGAAGSSPTDLRGMAAQYQAGGGFEPIPEEPQIPNLPAIVPPIAPPVAPRPPVTHDVTVVSTRKLRSAKVLGVPPEEFGIERGARDIKTANYCFHDVVTKTEGQLIAEGFDADCIRALTDYTGMDDIETAERDTVDEHTGTSAQSNAGRLVKITEHYVRIDYEGNGRPELYQVITGGDKGDILRKDGKDCITPFDAMPFAATTPVPMTHRFFGRSIADLVMPLQREKTALKRGALDNLYLRNNPRVEVAEQNAGPNTLDDLLVSRPGGVVRTKTAGGINWQAVPDVTTSIYPMLQYIDAELEIRTGLGRQTQGIDANALQNQSATAVAQVFSASQMRMKLIARIMAEGVRDIFALLHGTIRKHGQEQQKTVRLRNAWVSVDPRNWKTRDDMTIKVGLGTGGKAQQFAQTMALANVQKELIAGGRTNLVGDRQLYNTAAELTRIMGHKNPDQFFNDPEAKNPETGELMYPPPPPKPDPKVLQIEKQAELDKAADDRKAQIETVQMQADISAQRDKTQFETAQMERDFQLKRELALLNAQLDREKLEREEARKDREHAHKLEMARMGMAATAQTHDAEMTRRQAEHEAKMAERQNQANGDTET